MIAGPRWVRDPGQITGSEWKEHIISKRWEHPDTRVAVADFNGDGRLDVALSPSEFQGGSYRIAWYEAPTDPSEADDWAEHIVDSPVETVVHALSPADIDGDGWPDLVAASMHQERSPQEVRIYFNKRSGQEWMKQVVSTRGSHETRPVDIDGDGRIDSCGRELERPVSAGRVVAQHHGFRKPPVGCPPDRERGR